MNKCLLSIYYVSTMILGVGDSKTKKHSPGLRMLVLCEGQTSKTGMMYIVKALCGVTDAEAAGKRVLISLGNLRLPGGGDVF